jgi:hypothetical protein
VKKKRKQKVERLRQSATFGVERETCIAFLGEVDCPCQYRLPLDTTDAGDCSHTKQSRSSTVLLSVHLYQLLCIPSIVHLSLLLSVRQWSGRRAGPISRVQPKKIHAPLPRLSFLYSQELGLRELSIAPRNYTPKPTSTHPSTCIE